MAELHFFQTRDAGNHSPNRGKVHGSKRDSWTGRVVTACGSLEVSRDACAPAEVVEARRCRAAGCRQQWARWVAENVGPARADACTPPRPFPGR